MKLMGNHFEITVVANDETWANEKIQIGVNEIKRIENYDDNYYVIYKYQ